MTTNATRLKTLAIAFATVAPIVVGVSVVSAGTASASCRAGGIAGGEYFSSNDDLSRIEITFAPNGCTRFIEAYSTCENDPTSDCSWGQKKLRTDNGSTYAVYEWNNAREVISVQSYDSSSIQMRDYTGWKDGSVTDTTITLTKG